MVSLARFEHKNILFYFEKSHSFLEKKIETGWGEGAHQLLKSVFFPKNLTIRLLHRCLISMG
jgi:hypothetical protein